MYFLGQWGTVCLPKDERNYGTCAQTICSYLGVSPLAQHTMVPVSSTSFGSASADSPVWLVNEHYNVESCGCFESDLYEYPDNCVRQWGNDPRHDCKPEMNAAVVCNSKYNCNSNLF